MIERVDEGDVAVLKMANGAVNVMDIGLLRAITEQFAALAADGPSAVVITGVGRAFSAGIDLRSFLDGGPEHTGEFLPALSEALLSVFTFPRPVVAAVNGHAIAGGAVLAFAADARLMASGRAKIGTPELVVGVPFPRAPLEIVLHAVGPRVAHRLVFGAETVSPDQALALGLVDELVEPEQLVSQSIAVATRLATAIPADSFTLTKSQLRRETVERIQKYRADEDPRALDLWNTRASDGWTARYLEH